MRVSRRTAPLLLVAALCVALTLTSGGSAVRGAALAGNVNWSGFGNTPNENRYSPLTQIGTDNVGRLGRAFTVDLNKVVPGIKKGQQTYPVVIDGKMYVTSGDDQVFALNAATGDVLWHYTPSNLADFKNYGIVANRGVAYCDNRIFLLTLDMTIVELDPANGNQLARVPIGNAVPGAFASYGYSETSAPVCAGKTLVVGAAGSEYGVRGFVMAYKVPSLAPAWPNPFWTIPPNNTEWRSAGRIVGGCTNWTPETIDPTSNTLYFGVASAQPAYYPSLRPGPDPRCTSLVSVDLKTGKLNWWQQQLAFNEWAYDTAQPPLVYTAKIGGKSRRVVSVATMEGVWYAYDAKSGQPIYQRVKVIDNVEHPNLKPGQPVAVYPSSLGGINYSPASFDPATGYIYNAASETASVLKQDTSAQAKRKQLLAGDVFLGLSNGDFGSFLQNGWKDYGSVSAIDVGTGKRVWKFQTPQPERGGPTTTAGGVGFVGGGDGNLRAFDVKTGKVLWTFQTGFQIADGPAVYSVNGTEYIAIGVGGTPTSSGGGTVASQVQVFSLDGSKNESPAPVIAGVRLPASASTLESQAAQQRLAAARLVRATARADASSAARLVGPTGVVVKPWDPNTSNEQDVQGKLLLRGKPVEGAVIAVNGWTVPTPTDSSGSFTYPVDITMAQRHVAKVVDVSHASVGGKRLSKSAQDAVLGKTGGISVGYQVTGVKSKVQGGNVLVTGRIVDSTGHAPTPVILYTYLLKGTITDASGSPVKGATVVTRTNDRQFWTQSQPSGANGHYASFLVPADDEGDDPVPMTVGIGVGATAYTEPFSDSIPFTKLSSATLNVQLPSGSTTLPKSSLNPQPAPGAIYTGIIVGVTGRGGVIRPIRATWPDRNGNFSLLLPRGARGQTVRFWQSFRQFFSVSAEKPGARVAAAVYPKSLPSDAPQNLSTVKLAG